VLNSDLDTCTAYLSLIKFAIVTSILLFLSCVEEHLSLYWWSQNI